MKLSFDAGVKEGRKSTIPGAWVQSVTNSNQYAESLDPLIKEIRQNGINTLQGIADELNDKGVKTKTGGKFYAATVKLLTERINKINSENRSV